MLNHTLVEPFNVVRKALHMIDLNVAMWSQGFHVLLYKSKVGILNLEGRGWIVIGAEKGEFILWIRSSMCVFPLIESLICLMAIFIWSTSFSKCGTFWVMVLIDWSSHSTPLFAFLFSGFHLGSSLFTHWCRWCIFLWTSLVKSWFCCVNSATATVMDYNCCWTEASGASGMRFGWLKVSPVSGCSRPVVIDLVWTVQPFVFESKVTNTSCFP